MCYLPLLLDLRQQVHEFLLALR
ncbi:MAG: hypothetical protein JWN92_1125, partial [Candidatus Acidoferrum typicum]|nr:hypothetical protein [Candidatus Acidoferrum typicum]